MSYSLREINEQIRSICLSCSSIFMAVVVLPEPEGPERSTIWDSLRRAGRPFPRLTAGIYLSARKAPPER